MRHWTTEEVAFLRTHYGANAKSPMWAEDIGSRLKRDARTVMHKARYLGLARTKYVPGPDILNLYHEGLGDNAIARKLCISQSCVSRYLRALKMPAHAWTPKSKKRHGEMTLARMAAQKAREQEEAARLGYPGLELWEAKIMVELSGHSHTAAELAQDIGLSRRRTAWYCIGLIRKGLAMRVEGVFPYLYYSLRFVMAPEILRILRVAKSATEGRRL